MLFNDEEETFWRAFSKSLNLGVVYGTSPLDVQYKLKALNRKMKSREVDEFGDIVMQFKWSEGWGRPRNGFEDSILGLTLSKALCYDTNK